MHKINNLAKIRENYAICNQLFAVGMVMLLNESAQVKLCSEMARPAAMAKVKPQNLPISSGKNLEGNQKSITFGAFLHQPYTKR
ncbi:MAG: hypothetical protein KDD06_14590 [Phaeodactylibacter sp.]|nr:hypothetical protein [Phaeodactylibacter sp.]